MSAVEIRRHPAFDAWFKAMRDVRARAVIARRLARVASGLMGDVKSVGSGVSELRIDYGPGYRVYFTRRGSHLIVLLCGGDKDSQRADIARAVALAEDIE